MTRSTLSKHERLHELLGQFGEGNIDAQQFAKLMAEHGLTAEDIDLYCEGKTIE